MLHIFSFLRSWGSSGAFVPEVPGDSPSVVLYPVILSGVVGENRYVAGLSVDDGSVQKTGTSQTGKLRVGIAVKGA